MFKNERWSMIGELQQASRRLNAVFTDGKFFINGVDFKWVKNLESDNLNHRKETTQEKNKY